MNCFVVFLICTKVSAKLISEYKWVAQSQHTPLASFFSFSFFFYCCFRVPRQWLDSACLHACHRWLTGRWGNAGSLCGRLCVSDPACFSLSRGEVSCVCAARRLGRLTFRNPSGKNSTVCFLVSCSVISGHDTRSCPCRFPKPPSLLPLVSRCCPVIATRSFSLTHAVHKKDRIESLW